MSSTKYQTKNPVNPKNEVPIDISTMDKQSLKQKNVLEVYDQIAEKFDKTRTYLWPTVKQFLENIPQHYLLLEVGVGNGRNLDGVKCHCMGIDVCQKFLEMSKSKGEMARADQALLPFRTETFDVLISIAVFHHLPTEEERLQCAEDMMRILRKGGKLFLQNFEKRDSQTSDIFLKWKNPDNQVYNRYYHRFTENELQNYFKDYECEVIREANNIIFIITK
jgi:alkylated DNA repair protein alkB family protein 8